MRILVVEDEPTLREQLMQAIAAAGHTVEGAADGRERTTIVTKGKQKVM